MIQKINSNNRVQKVGGEVQDFKIDPEAQIETLFRRFTEQYSYPIESLIREVTSNATDANMQLKENCELAGVEYVEKPVIVKLVEKGGNKQIQFIDSGIGMSKDVVSNVYMEYLKTTKDKTNNQQGCFGMGAKTPMTYLGETPYQLVTRFNGTELKYMFWYGINAKGLVVPQSSLISQKETNEPNGTMISVPILEGDFHRFVSGINEQLPYFKNIVYVGEGSDLMVNTALKLNNYSLYEADSFVMRIPKGEEAYPNHYNNIHAVIDQVAYPLNLDRIDLSYSLKQSLITLPIGLRFNIGDLSVVDSREQLKYDNANVETITKKISEFLVEIKTLFNNQTKNIKTLPELIRLVDSKENSLIINDTVSLQLDKNIIGKDIGFDFNSFELEDNLDILKYFASKNTNDTMFRTLFDLTFNVERVGRAVPKYQKTGLIPDYNSLNGVAQDGVFITDISYDNTDCWLKRYFKEDIIAVHNRAILLRRKVVKEDVYKTILLKTSEIASDLYHSLSKNDYKNYDDYIKERDNLFQPLLDVFIPRLDNVLDKFYNYVSDNVLNLQEYERLNVTEDYKENWKQEQRANRKSYQRNSVEGVVFRNVTNGRTSTGARVNVQDLIDWKGTAIVFEYKEGYDDARELLNEINNIFGRSAHNDYIGDVSYNAFNCTGKFSIIGCVTNNYKHIENLENVYFIDEFRKKFIMGKRDEIVEALALSKVYKDEDHKIFPRIENKDLFLAEGFEKVDAKAVEYTKAISDAKENFKEKGLENYSGGEWFAKDYLTKYYGWDSDKIEKRVNNLAKRLTPSFKRETNYLNKLNNKNGDLIRYISLRLYDNKINNVEIEILKRGLK